MRVPLAVLLLLAVPAAQACSVTPMLDIDLHQDAPCLKGFDTEDECDRVPAPGEPVQLDGVIRWSWDVDECTTEGGLNQDDLRITFSEAASNPAWLPMRFDPQELVVPPHEYYDPQYVRYDAAAGRLYSEKEQAFTATVEFLRAPTAEEQEKLALRNGIAVTFAKAHAQADGVRDSFAVSQLSFDARHLQGSSYPLAERVDDESTPAPPVAVLLGLLVLLSRASAGRRRR